MGNEWEKKPAKEVLLDLPFKEAGLPHHIARHAVNKSSLPLDPHNTSAQHGLVASDLLGMKYRFNRNLDISSQLGIEVQPHMIVQ